jgi:hypothetical protein
MKSKGRPRSTPVQLKNGFYIEVCNKGVKKGVKIWSDTQKAMEDAASQYSKFKEVIILGEYKSGMPFMAIDNRQSTIGNRHDY